MGFFDIFKPQHDSSGKRISATGTRSGKNAPAYDFNTLEGIYSIPIPRYDPLHSISSPVNNIEYILQRKATEHKKNGRMDLAIACLRKSNEIFPYSNFRWQAKDYLRLVKYLEQNNQREEAIKEQRSIEINHPELFDKRVVNKQKINECLLKANKYKADLVYITTSNKCNLCNIYNNQIFSISGKSKNYKKIPREFIDYGGFCKDCVVGIVIKFDK